MVNTVLNMDPLSFILALIAVFGAVTSSICFLRQYTPSAQYLAFADLVSQSRISWDASEKDQLLPDLKQRTQLLGELEKFENDVCSLMFVTMPTKNILAIARRWLKCWHLRETLEKVQIFRVGLLASSIFSQSAHYYITHAIQTISQQRRHIQIARARAASAGVAADVSSLEKICLATTDSFISSLGGDGTNLCASDDTRASSLSATDTICSSGSGSSESILFASPVNISTQCDYLLKAKLGETSVIDKHSYLKRKTDGKSTRRTRLPGLWPKSFRGRLRSSSSDIRKDCHELPF
ncbi:hypothetical protein B0H34DRAFT_690412 [Crassisporium funariophilum]|nr:hypothetical protein B0H34DRAFT_690412 [Crassisporium funariophilum]